MITVLADPHILPDLWDVISPFVMTAAQGSGGRFEPVDILNCIISGEFQLWLILDDSDESREDAEIKGIAVTRIINFPRLRACEILAGVGEDFRGMAGCIDEVETWAKAQGCSQVMPLCRPGWEKALAPRGYTKTHVLLEKTL